MMEVREVPVPILVICKGLTCIFKAVRTLHSLIHNYLLSMIFLRKMKGKKMYFSTCSLVMSRVDKVGTLQVPSLKYRHLVGSQKQVLSIAAPVLWNDLPLLQSDRPPPFILPRMHFKTLLFHQVWKLGQGQGGMKMWMFYF